MTLEGILTNRNQLSEDILGDVKAQLVEARTDAEREGIEARSRAETERVAAEAERESEARLYIGFDKHAELRAD